MTNRSLGAAYGQRVVMYVRFDNEFGDTKQVIRLAKCVAKVRRNICC